MVIDIFDRMDIANVLEALRQSNERMLNRAELYGMNAQVARLCRCIYGEALDDVAAVFGLTGMTEDMLRIPAYMIEGR